jgi:hypothetical protein
MPPVAPTIVSLIPLLLARSNGSRAVGAVMPPVSGTSLTGVMRGSLVYGLPGGPVPGAVTALCASSSRGGCLRIGVTHRGPLLGARR